MSKKRPVLCIELLKTFSKNELDNLEKILSCEYFNTDRWAKKLFKVLKKYVLKSDIFDDDMQCMVYHEVFDHLPIPKGALTKNERSWFNQKLNELMRLAELFLSIEQLKKNDDHKCDLLYSELLARKQYQSLDKHLKRDKARLDKQDKKGVVHYTQKCKIEKLISNYIHLGSRNFSNEKNLKDLIHGLDMGYALDKLEIQIVALSRKYTPGGTEYDLSSMEAVTLLLDLPQYAKDPIIALYRANISLVQTNSEAEYFKLLNLLEDYEPFAPTDVLISFYTTALNYCAYQVKIGELKYDKEMFHLFKKMDDKKLLIDRGIIRPIKLKNLVTIACRVGEYEWAKNAIERYRQYIPEEVRNDVYHLNLGNIAFHQKDYTTAHSEFILVGKVNKTYEINVKVAILKCLYEKDNATPQAFRSAEKFFRENKSLPQIDKKNYRNFIKILKLIYNIRHNINATLKDIGKVKKEMNDQKINSDKRWLLEKIEELEHKIK